MDIFNSFLYVYQTVFDFGYQPWEKWWKILGISNIREQIKRCPFLDMPEVDAWPVAAVSQYSTASNYKMVVKTLCHLCPWVKKIPNMFPIFQNPCPYGSGDFLTFLVTPLYHVPSILLEEVFGSCRIHRSWFINCPWLSVPKIQPLGWPLWH